MANKIKLSKDTIKLIEVLKEKNSKAKPDKNVKNLLSKLSSNCRRVPPALALEESALRELLTKIAKAPKPNEQKLRFHLQELEVALLKELSNSKALGMSNTNEGKDKKKGNWKAKLRLGGLALLGTIYFACEGFDGMTALLGILPTPFAILLAGGLIFSIVSVFVFYSFDLAEISDNLKVSKKEVPKLLDLYLEEAQFIEKLALEIDKMYRTAELETVEEYQAMLVLLQARNDGLDGPREKFKRSSNKTFLRVFEKVAGAIAGVLFLSSGFFAGQTVALFVVGLLGISAASAFWPVVVTGLIVGASAALIYWFVERPGIESLIRRKLGLDPAKIEQLQAKEPLVKILNELDTNLKIEKERLLKELNQQPKIQDSSYQAIQKGVQQADTATLETPIITKLPEEEAKGFATSPITISGNRHNFLHATASRDRSELASNQPAALYARSL